jgi:hypothetical protein
VPWIYQYNNPEFDNEGRDGNGYMKLKARKDKIYTKWDTAFYEENITIIEPLSEGRIARFSIDYYYDDKGVSEQNLSLYMAIIIGGVEANKTVKCWNLLVKTWTTLTFSYIPTSVGHSLPNQVSLRMGMTIHNDTTIDAQDQKIWFDNVEYEIWTEINQNHLLEVYDIEKDHTYSYQNTSFGQGRTLINISRNRNITRDIVFTISKNSSFIEEFEVFNITITSSVVRSLNSSIAGNAGSLISFDNGIKWRTEFTINIPFSYLNSWVQIEKPVDWNVTSILDGFNLEKIQACSGTEIGSNLILIPEDKLSQGLWILHGSSQNYINSSQIQLWTNSSFISQSNLFYGDIFRIKVDINNTVNLSNTQITANIYYPNDTLFWNQSIEPPSYQILYGNFTVGSNMSVGLYTVKIQWVNGQNSTSIDKKGFEEFNFIVRHHSNISAEETYFELISGEPLLIRVKLMDIDFNSTVSFATVTYNSTFGQSGPMIYQGSGTYLADIDTSSLELGIYYISVNSTSEYYENHSVINLIQVKIIAQSLSLDTPHKVIETMANSYAICNVNVTGAISGVMIWDANISTNWQNPYNYIDHNNGTYTLNFSTTDLPTQGIIETFSVSVYANKTNFGSTNGFITITIHPIQAIMNVNSSFINAKINEIIDIKINYTIEESGVLIQEVNYSVLWSSLFNVIPDDEGIILQLNTINLTVDTYTAIIKAEKVGYETSFKTITIQVDYIDIEVRTINFKDSLETLIGETRVIIIKLIDPYTFTNIDNASVFFSWDFGVGHFYFLSNGTYEVELKIPPKIEEEGNYKMTLIVSKEDSIYKTTEFSFIISVDRPTQSNNIPWYIFIILISIISILGIVSIRTYVYKPLKTKKKNELLAKTQRYKDITNIETILITNRHSGVYLYSISYSLLKHYQNELLSGFIQAITLISNEIVGEEKVEHIPIKSDKYKGHEKVIELDFKHFNFFISDYKDLRSIFILKDKASERFKNKTAEFHSDLDQLLTDKFSGRWDGNLKIFNKIIPSLLEKHFHVYYKDKFKINPKINIPRITNEGEFNKLAVRLLNVILSMNRQQQEFYLEDAVKTVHAKNQDKVIKALELLIEKQIVISALSKDTQ